MGVGQVRGLLWAVRELRRGEVASAGRRTRTLSSVDRSLVGTAPLADVCRELAGRIHAAVDDPRAADACIRFFGLGRLPEGLEAIAASSPRARANGGSLRPRRVEQLRRTAEDELSANLAAHPLAIAARPADQDVEAVFEAGADPVDRQRVLLRAWSDVPDGDHQSALALLLFECERGLRASSTLTLPQHRETRRRLRRRAHAIVEVAIQRTDVGRRHQGPPAIELAADLLLGPHVLATDGATWEALDAVCRLSERDGASGPGCPDDRSPDLAALDRAAACAHRLAQAGSPHAKAALGMVRRAVLHAGEKVPASLAARVLVSITVLARLQDDPAGFPAAWEALRICRLALTCPREPPDALQVTASALRALQELAELHERFGQLDQAMRTLDEARELLRRRGDPDHEEQPDGWLQQLLFSQGMIQRRGAHIPRSRDPLRWLHGAQVAEARSADLVRNCELLPDEWGLSAEAILAALVVDEMEGLLREDNGLAAAQARERAQRIIAENEAGWRRHREPGLAMAKSARLTAILAASRIALVTGDLDGYRVERDRLATAAGAWLCHHDIEALDALERAAENHGVPRLGLARRALTAAPFSQRSWAAPAPA